MPGLFPQWAVDPSSPLFHQVQGRGPTRDEQRRMNQRSRDELERARRGLGSRPSHGQVVASVSFGFWAQMTHRQRTPIFWAPMIRAAFWRQDGQFGDTFARPTTTPMLLDRAVVFDVSAIDTAELTLGPDRPIKPTGHGQNEAPDTVGSLEEAGRPQFGVPIESRLSVPVQKSTAQRGWRRHP